MNKGHQMFQMTDAQVAQQEQVDAEAFARVRFDEDPHGFFHECEEHGNWFLTYCVVCPEDHGNGKVSEAALKDQQAARDARWLAECEVPF
jgi:hypothetical protein